MNDQPPAARQVLACAKEAVDLLVRFGEVLKRTERDDDQAKFLAHVEPRHVTLNKVHALARFPDERSPLLRPALQHSLQNIESRHPLPTFPNPHPHPPPPPTQPQT